jgi:putative hemolysin
MVKAFSLLSGFLFRKEGRPSPGMAQMLTEDETRVLLTSGIKGMPAFRKKMIAEIFDLASRPVKEIMVPRPEIKAVEATASREQVLETVLAERFSRFPVYRGRLDHIEGFIHTKDLIPYLVDGRTFDLAAVVRKPYFVPESAPVEKVLLQMQDRAIHMAFVIDEFGNMEGLVTFEDILEEIVGDILDESDDKAEAWHSRTEDGAVIVKGSAAVKDVNEELAFGLPESADYTTLAGFFLYEFGRIPAEKDVLVFRGRRFVVEKMSKRHIGLIRVEPGKA